MQNWLVKCLCFAIQTKKLTYPGEGSKCLKMCSRYIAGLGLGVLSHPLLTDGAHDSSPANDGDSIPLVMEIGSEKDGLWARPMDLSGIFFWSLSWHKAICPSMPTAKLVDCEPGLWQLCLEEKARRRAVTWVPAYAAHLNKVQLSFRHLKNYCCQFTKDPKKQG